MKRSLALGGIFAGQLFGTQDEWNTPQRDMTFHSKEEVLKSLSGMEVLHFVEANKEGSLANGLPKHWHVFHIIARKK